MRGMANDKQGRPLPPNTYHNGGYYRYKLANGKLKTIRDQEGKPVNYELACQIAERANKNRDSSNTSIKSIRFWLEKHIEWREKENKALKDKTKWQGCKRSMFNFADTFSHLNFDRIELLDLDSWWESLTYHQQQYRRPVLNKFFQWAMLKGACKINPFTSNDGMPRLLNHTEPEKERSPMELEHFWGMYNSDIIEKYPYIKVGMAIALVTKWR